VYVFILFSPCIVYCIKSNTNKCTIYIYIYIYEKTLSHYIISYYPSCFDVYTSSSGVLFIKFFTGILYCTVDFEQASINHMSTAQLVGQWIKSDKKCPWWWCVDIETCRVIRYNIMWKCFSYIYIYIVHLFVFDFILVYVMYLLWLYTTCFGLFCPSSLTSKYQNKNWKEG
jgi:hypothetical protein